MPVMNYPVKQSRTQSFAMGSGSASVVPEVTKPSLPITSDLAYQATAPHGGIAILTFCGVKRVTDRYQHGKSTGAFLSWIPSIIVCKLRLRTSHCRRSKAGVKSERGFGEAFFDDLFDQPNQIGLRCDLVSTKPRAPYWCDIGDMCLDGHVQDSQSTYKIAKSPDSPHPKPNWRAFAAETTLIS